MANKRNLRGGSVLLALLLAVFAGQGCQGLAQLDQDPEPRSLTSESGSEPHDASSQDISLIKTFKGDMEGIGSVAFSPDGRHALSGGGDGILRLWDIATDERGKLIRTFQGHTDWVFSVAFSPDGQTALSGSKDKAMRLWDIKSGKPIRTFEGHTDWVGSVAYGPGGQRALSGSNDGTLRLWDIETGKLIRTFKGHTDWVYSVAFSPNGQRFLSGSEDGTLRLWSIEERKSIRTFKGHKDRVFSVAFSPYEDTAVSGSGDGTLRLWNIETGETIHIFKGHKDAVLGVALSSDGRHILSGSDDRTLRLWDVKTGKMINTSKGHRAYSVAFSPDGNTALSGSSDASLRLWTLKKWGRFDDIPQKLERFTAAEIDPNKWLFVIGVEKYRKTDNIVFSRRSAELFAEVAHKTLGIGKDRTTILLDDAASSGAIEDNLRELLEKVDQEDSIYFYFSGHGIPVPDDDNEPYILPADKIPKHIGNSKFYRVNSIYKLLERSGAGQVFAFMDSCFTGPKGVAAQIGPAQIRPAQIRPKKPRIEDDGKLAVLTAGTEVQYSNAYWDKGHCLFSYFLLQELLEGHETFGGLVLQVQEKVKEHTKPDGVQKQNPVFKGNKDLQL